MTNQLKLLKELRRKDHEEFDGPSHSYQLFIPFKELDNRSNLEKWNKRILQFFK